MLLWMNLDNLVLRPNCLLTKSPLVFVPGPRSLFHYQYPYGYLPQFLHEHGYVTKMVSLPFRRSAARKLAFEKWLNTVTGKHFHLVMDQLVYDELKSVFLNPSVSESFRSISVISSDYLNLETRATNFVVSETATPGPSYWLHQVLNRMLQTKTPPYARSFLQFNRTQLDRYLDHCVNLAETEIYA